MTDISNPKEFLEEALQAVDSLKADKTAQTENQTRLKEAERALGTLKKTIEKEKADTLKARRADIDSEYAKQLKASESGISKAESERSKARSKGVNDRIAESLVPAKNDIKVLKEQIAAVVSSSGLPAFCRTGAFYRLFAAKGVKEILVLILTVAVVLAAVPLAATFFIGKTWIKVLVFAAIDIAAVALYVAVYSGTVAKKQDAVAQCRLLFDRIKSDEKIIRQITRNIRGDKDDSVYNLGSFDEDIAKKTSVRDDITQKRQQALSEFDNRTADTIRAEIDSRYAEKLTETQNAFNVLSDTVKSLADKITAEEMEISRFTQYVGTKNLNHDSLQGMIDLVSSGEAGSVSDAALKYNSKGN